MGENTPWSDFSRLKTPARENLRDLAINFVRGWVGWVGGWKAERIVAQVSFVFVVVSLALVG